MTVLLPCPKIDKVPKTLWPICTTLGIQPLTSKGCEVKDVSEVVATSSEKAQEKRQNVVGGNHPPRFLLFYLFVGSPTAPVGLSREKVPVNISIQAFSVTVNLTSHAFYMENDVNCTLLMIFHSDPWGDVFYSVYLFTVDMSG